MKRTRDQEDEPEEVTSPHTIRLLCAVVGLWVAGCSVDLVEWKCRIACEPPPNSCASEASQCVSECAAAARNLSPACGQCVVDHSGLIALSPPTNPINCTSATGSTSKATCTALCATPGVTTLANANGPGASAAACHRACTVEGCGAEVTAKCSDACQAMAAGHSADCANCIITSVFVSRPLSNGPCTFRVPYPSIDCAASCFP
jgi:hypothetical protein